MNRQYSALSGAAVLLILVNHAIHLGFQVTPVDGVVRSVLVLLQALGVFAVPAFLFISGAFLAYSANQISIPFIRSSLGRILWPYVCWSLLFYLMVLLTTGERYSVAGYLKNLVVGYPYHFVPLLIFWYVGVAVLLRASKRHGGLVLVVTGVAQVVLLTARFPERFGDFNVLQGVDRLVPVLFTSMSDWAIYFPLGLVLGLHQSSLKPMLIRFRWLSLAAAAGLFFLGILNAFRVASVPWAPFAAPLPLMLLLPIIDRNAIPFARWFEQLGRQSYGVYLSHFVVINLLAWLAVQAQLGQSPLSVLVFPLLLIAALAIPLWMMRHSARTVPGRKIYRQVFGIAPPTIDVRPRRPDRAPWDKAIDAEHP